MWFKIAIISLVSINAALALNATLDPDADLSIDELAAKYGYPLESHEITTNDGYILKMYRIPHGRGGVGVNQKPLLTVHGFYFQSEHYIIGEGYNASLAFMSADNGYDVWLGNCRGTKNGKKHKTLNPSQKEFWDFSFHNMGVDDLPTMIDYVLANTQKEKLHYIGHSQGGAAFYVMCSEKPEYQQKVIMASLMAPAGFLPHCRSTFFRTLAYNRKMLDMFTRMFHLYEYPPGNTLENTMEALCVNARNPMMCESVLYVFNGGRSGEMNMEMLPSIVKYLSSASIKQLLHFFQMIVSGHFRQYDYESPKENMRRYGSAEPPDYKVENIKVPIAIYNSLGDNLVDYRDVQYMCEKLQNCLKVVTMDNPKWSHIDFLFSKNAGNLLYGPLLEYMNQFN